MADRHTASRPGGARLFIALLAALLMALAGTPRAAPPGHVLAAPAPGVSVAAASQATSKAGLVGEAFTLISNDYFNPVDSAGLLNAAWDAAVDTAAGAGNTAPPPRPAVSGDAVTALMHFDAAYGQLETATAIDPTVLAYDAIRGMTGFINNCHTGFLTPAQEASFQSTLVGGFLVGAGAIRRASRPWVVVYVVPGGPADQAGMRAGDTILAYDGDTADDAPLTHVRTEGQTLTYTVQRPGEDAPRDLTVTIGRYQFPRIEARVIDGTVGYIRFFIWEGNPEQAQAIRDTIAGFEAQGVTSWVLDVRANGGGLPDAIANLFLPAGQYLRFITRGGNSVSYIADGNTIAPARPLAVLIGPGSGSASEIIPEALREAGRAVLVGEHTPGCMAFRGDLTLSDGSVVALTIGHALIGSDRTGGTDLEGIGVAPDIVAPETVDDLIAGNDPGLAAAVQYLEGVTAPQPAAIP
ncbi:MAG: S41 family peptidase [Dehalococcoidia bacterium]